MGSERVTEIRIDQKTEKMFQDYLQLPENGQRMLEIIVKIAVSKCLEDEEFIFLVDYICGLK